MAARPLGPWKKRFTAGSSEVVSSCMLPLARIPMADPTSLALSPNLDLLSLTVRKTIRARVNGPFELAVTPRMEGFAFERGVYFAYILVGCVKSSSK